MIIGSANLSVRPQSSRPCLSRPSSKFERPGRSMSGKSSGFDFLDEVEESSNKKPIQPKKKHKLSVSKDHKYHVLLSNLHKEYEGLHLDYEARLQVIRDLRDLDCLSDNGTDNNATDEPATSAESPIDCHTNKEVFGIEKRHYKKSLENYINREELIRERLPTNAEIEASINRRQVRDRNINRAVDILVKKRHAKDAQHNQMMLTYLKEAASAENQQIRRFAIGFTTRLINKIKAEYVTRAVHKQERRLARQQRRVKAKATIVKNWRISRYRRFMKIASDYVNQMKDVMFQEAMRDDYRFKKKLHQQNLKELAELEDYKERQLAYRQKLFSSARRDFGSDNAKEMYETKAEAEFARTRPDLEPFSGIINRKVQTAMQPKPVLFEDDVSSAQHDVRYPNIKRFDDVIYSKNNMLAMVDDVDDKWFKTALITKDQKALIKADAKKESTVFKTLMKIHDGLLTR